MSDDRIRSLIGEKLRRLRREAGFKTQEEFGRRVGGVHRSMISQIETGHRGIPKDRMSDFAEALGVDEYELTPQSLGAAIPSGFVRSSEELSTWRDLIILDNSMGWEVKILLLSLGVPGILDREQWVASVSIDHLVRETGRSRKLVEQFWQQMLESGYVNRIGEAKWVLVLRFP